MYQGENQAEASAKTGLPGAALGIYAKSQATFNQNKELEVVDSDTGDLLKFRQRGNALELIRDPAEVRLERYALQSVARELLPKSRTAKCLRTSYLKGGKVEVLYSPAHQSASFGGLVTCASVWNCPICMAKITERKRVELQAAMVEAKAQGLHCYLLTLTHPHTRFDPLSDLLTSEQRALKFFFEGRAIKGLFRELGRVGQVRAWEVTHGRRRAVSHGWHPHFHILLILDQPIGHLPTVELALYVHWANACVRAGLDRPSARFGVRLDDGSRAADYVAKMGLEESSAWGLDSEMTKGHCKRSRDGETPLDLLRSRLAYDDDTQAAWLFREYAAAFRGKRQLVWSRGLRDRLGLGAAPTDEEVAAAHEDDCFLLSEIERDQWALILRFDLRGEVAEIARHGDRDALVRFLDSLKGGCYGQATS